MVFSERKQKRTPGGARERHLGWLKNSDAQWPWDKKGLLFWLVEFKGEPFPKEKEKRAESTGLGKSWAKPPGVPFL